MLILYIWVIYEQCLDFLVWKNMCFCLDPKVLIKPRILSFSDGMEIRLLLIHVVLRDYCSICLHWTRKLTQQLCKIQMFYHGVYVCAFLNKSISGIGFILLYAFMDLHFLIGSGGIRKYLLCLCLFTKIICGQCRSLSNDIQCGGGLTS